MLAEKQIRAILKECETALSVDLAALRLRLQHQRDAAANLWELAVLYGSLLMGTVQHEPSDGAPDIFIEANSGLKLWLEVAYVSPRDEIHYKALQDFPNWVRQQLQKFGCSWGRQAYIRLDPARRDESLRVPPQNQWSQMLRGDSWKAFVNLTKAQDQVMWICPKGNLVIQATRSIRPGAGWPVPDIPKHPREHPIYRAIAKKAQQARRWADAGGNYSPLFLILGTEDQSGRIDPDRINGVTAEQAIYAALADTKRWDPITIYNRIGSWSGGCLRVRNSGLIAGVVFAKLKTQLGGFSNKLNRVWHGTLYMNPHPQVLVPGQYQDLLCRLNLNRIEYGPGWEDWRDEDHGDRIGRIRRRGGTVVTKPKQDGSFEIEIPTVLLTRILAGDVTAEAAWREYDSEIRDLFKSALVRGQEITGASIEEPDPKSREEARLCLKFGPPQHAVIRRKKD